MIQDFVFSYSGVEQNKTASREILITKLRSKLLAMLKFKREINLPAPRLERDINI